MRHILAVLLVAALAVTSFAATEPNPSQRQRELIETLLALSNSEALQRSVMDSMFAEIQKQLVDAAGPEEAEEAAELFTIFRERVAKVDLQAPMHEATIRTYAKYFTETELADLVAFYRSPTGRKQIEVMPQLLQEQMQSGVQYLSPKIDEAMRDAMREQEKRRPWKRTMTEIRNVASALEAYAVDNDRYPNADYAGLKELLSPAYMLELPEKDIWDHAYAYAVSPDGMHYRLVSAGADGIFEWDSRVFKEGAEEIRYRDSLKDDVIFADGEWLQLPVQAKPKGE
jgi:hypothetical protein